MLRSLLAALLLLALIPAAALANTSVWAGRTILDRETFSATVEHALEDPALEAELTERVTRELFGALVETDGRTRPVLAQLLGLTPGAPDGRILSALEPRVATALGDPRARAARSALVADVHAALRGATSDSGSVHLVGDQFVVDFRPLLEAVLAAIDATLGGLGLTVPAGADTRVFLDPAPGLSLARDSLTALDRLVLILPLTTLLLGLLVVLVAHRRGRAMGLVGGALAVAGLTGIGLVLAGTVVVARVGGGLDPILVNGTLGAFTGVLLVQSAALVGVGLVLAFVGAIASARTTRPRPQLAEEW